MIVGKKWSETAVGLEELVGLSTGRSVRNLDLTKMSLRLIVGSSESNKRCRLKEFVASWGRRKDFKVFLNDTCYGAMGRIVCDNKRNATGLVCGSLTGFLLLRVIE